MPRALKNPWKYAELQKNKKLEFFKKYQLISIDIKRKLKKLNLELTKGPEMVRSKAEVHFDKCNNFNIVEFSYLVLKKLTFQKIFG